MATPKHTYDMALEGDLAVGYRDGPVFAAGGGVTLGKDGRIVYQKAGIIANPAGYDALGITDSGHYNKVAIARMNENIAESNRIVKTERNQRMAEDAAAKRVAGQQMGSSDFEPWKLVWGLAETGLIVGEPFIDQAGESLMGPRKYNFTKGVAVADYNMVTGLSEAPGAMLDFASSLWQDPGGTVSALASGLWNGLKEWVEFCKSGNYAGYECAGNVAPEVALMFAGGAGVAARGADTVADAGRILSKVEDVAPLASKSDDLLRLTQNSIDEAVEAVLRDENKMIHLFDNTGHKLDNLVDELGSQENTIRAVLEAADGKLPTSGIFENIPVQVGEYTVFIRGNVIDGVPRIGTFFIP